MGGTRIHAGGQGLQAVGKISIKRDVYFLVKPHKLSKQSCLTQRLNFKFETLKAYCNYWFLQHLLVIDWMEKGRRKISIEEMEIDCWRNKDLDKIVVSWNMWGRFYSRTCMFSAMYIGNHYSILFRANTASAQKHENTNFYFTINLNDPSIYCNVFLISNTLN